MLNRRGFSLIEIVLAVVISATVAVAILPFISAKSDAVSDTASELSAADVQLRTTLQSRISGR